MGEVLTERPETNQKTPIVRVLGEVASQNHGWETGGPVSDVVEIGNCGD